MKKLFSFLRKPKAKPNSGPRNRVLTAAEIAAQEEQKRKLAEQQAKAASRKKAQRTAKAAKPRNRILTEGESATTGARPTRTRWFKRRKQRSPQERAARRTQKQRAKPGRGNSSRASAQQCRRTAKGPPAPRYTHSRSSAARQQSANAQIQIASDGDALHKNDQDQRL